MIDDDIIAAIASGFVEAAIGVIRVSGKNSIELLKKIFYSKKCEYKPYQVCHGYLKNNNGQIVDEVLVSIFRAPHSYTGEDSFEINCHGGLLIMKNVLDLVLNNGARLALPGEFTKRAFLNNKIDLVQATAIANLISSKTQKALEIAFNQYFRKNASTIEDLREKIIFLMAENEVSIDHLDEHINTDITKKLSLLKEISNRINTLINAANIGKYFYEGAKVAIIGKPNVGKSSLLNALVGYNRAIVTEIPGTTTDIVSETINLNGIPLKILDTAGIRQHTSKIESIGIQMAQDIIREADLIIAMFDASRVFDSEDDNILKIIKNKKNCLIVLNKCDLPIKFKYSFTQTPIMLSCSTKKGIDELKTKLHALLVENFDENEIISLNASQITALKNALKIAKKIEKSYKNFEDPTLIVIQLQQLASLIEQIIGKIENEDVLDNVFKNFCVGK